MNKIKVGLMTMSDGRPYIHSDYESLNMERQHEIAMVLEGTGMFEVIEAASPINSNAKAKEEGEKLRRSGAEVTIFNYIIWCYPSFTVAAQNFAPAPYLLFSNLHPSECGMVGMLAAAGSLDQIGVPYKKMWGSVNDKEVLDKMVSFLKAAAAVKRLRGLTFGNFGGRALGMYTATASVEQWQKLFGVDIENIEQEEIVRYGNATPDEKVENAFNWLTEKVGNIAYDGKILTPEKLKIQIRSYYGMKQIIEERGLDFVGVKAHGDLTDTYCTMNVAEAFLNDPYDFDGPKEPIVASTEADMDGALTMQIFKHLTGMPVLFADVRHYDKENDVWFMSNSGTHATYYAGRSYDPDVNLPKVSIYPEESYYPAGGGSVQHFAKGGKVTLARLARKNGSYCLTIVPGEFIEFDEEKAKALAQLTTPAWPIAFTRLKVSADEFLENYPCNHTHGVYGDYTADLVEVAKLLGIEYRILI